MPPVAFATRCIQLMNDLSAVKVLLEEADANIRACRLQTAWGKVRQATRIAMRLAGSRLPLAEGFRPTHDAQETDIALGECRLRQSQILLIKGQPREAMDVVHLAPLRSLDGHHIERALVLARAEALEALQRIQSPELVALVLESSAISPSTKVGALTRALALGIKCGDLHYANYAYDLVHRNSTVECPERLPALLRWQAIYSIEIGDHEYGDRLLTQSLAACEKLGSQGYLDKLLLRFAISHLYFATGKEELGIEELWSAAVNSLNAGAVGGALTAKRALSKYFS